MSLFVSLVTVLVPLADEVPTADEVKPGWIAVVVVLLLILATILLWLNMRSRLGKIRFDQPDRGSGGDPERTGDGDLGDSRSRPDEGDRPT